MAKMGIFKKVRKPGTQYQNLNKNKLKGANRTTAQKSAAKRRKK